MDTQQLSVAGMTCNGCVESVTRALQAVDGVKNLDVSLASGTATIQFDEQLTSVDELAQAVRSAGYDMGVGGLTGAPQTKRKGCCS